MQRVDDTLTERSLDGQSDSISTDHHDFSVQGTKWGDNGFGSRSGQVTWSTATSNFTNQPFNFDSALTGDFLTATRNTNGAKF